MTNHSSFFTSMLTLSFLLATLAQCYSKENNDSYSICSQPFSCGTLTNVSYPFWGGNRPLFCGRDGFKLTCMHNQTTLIQLGPQKFNVLDINPTASTMKMVRTDLVYDRCSSKFTNTSLNGSPFSFLPTVRNVTIAYECPSEISFEGSNFTCRNDSNKHGFYVVKGSQVEQLSGLHKCGVSIQAQVSQDVVLGLVYGVMELQIALDEGFDVGYYAEWSPQCTVCRESGGVCVTNENHSTQFSCYCSHETHASVCSTNKATSSFLFSLFHFVMFKGEFGRLK